MNVLSLFDGMSCGQIALNRAGIPYDNYFASEIDAPGIEVTMRNYPGTIQIGDVEKVHFNNGSFITPTKIYHVGKIDLLLGGSPCQGFSAAGEGLNFSDPRSRLFFEYVRLMREILDENPDMKFLLESVPMKADWQDTISKFLGVDPVVLNSSLVSGQHRERLYWTNIQFDPLIRDKGIRFSSVLENLMDVLCEPKYLHSEKAIIYMNRAVHGGRSHWDFAHHSDSAHNKSRALVANLYKGVPYNVVIDRRADNPHPTKAVATNPTLAVDGGLIRKLTPVECERLQTVPDNYTAGVSDGNRYKMLGNGWTVDIVVHILKHL